MQKLADYFNSACRVVLEWLSSVLPDATFPILAISEWLGIAACLFVVLAFSVSSPLLLRILAIASNLLFIAYALSAGLRPILILHSLLLPINLFHLAGVLARKRERAGTRACRSVRPYPHAIRT